MSVKDQFRGGQRDLLGCCSARSKFGYHVAIACHRTRRINEPIQRAIATCHADDSNTRPTRQRDLKTALTPRDDIDRRRRNLAAGLACHFGGRLESRLPEYRLRIYDQTNVELLGLDVLIGLRTDEHVALDDRRSGYVGERVQLTTFEEHRIV